MHSADISLITKRRFGPLFATQFLGAFNDNLFKTAMLFLIAFHILAGDPQASSVLATVAGGVFILPFFLFSSLAGQLADSIDKAVMARAVKVAEVAIMAVGAFALSHDSIPLLMVVLFAMGAHSTFFGPIKYSILPQHLGRDELLGGTGLVEAGTFLAILTGQILGGLLSPSLAAWAVVAVALLGLAASWNIPPAPAARPDLKLDWNIAAQTTDLLRSAMRTRPLFLAILGISWFFALGAVFTSQFVPLTRNVLGADESVATLFLAAFSIGVAVGSLVVNRLLKGEISARYVPISALALSLFILDFWFACGRFSAGTGLISLGGFLSEAGAWRLIFDLFAIAVAGGMFIVPLYAILQTAGDPAERSRDIAANNVVNAATMVVAAAGAALLVGLGFSIPTVFLMLGLMNLGVAVVACGLLPDTVIKSLIKATLRVLYRVEVEGLENYTKAGERAVVVVNHVSFLDGLLLAAFLPGKPTFAINSFIARQWWVKPFLNLIDAFPVDPTNPMAAKSMVRAVQAGRKLVIFPEGRITVTGALMKVFEGPGMVADKADANIVPVRIDGAQYSPFSRLRGKLRLRTFPKIRLTLLPPTRFTLEEGLTGRRRRAAAGQKLYDLMSNLIFETTDIDQTLFDALLDAKKVYGGSAEVVDDVNRKPLSYRRLVAGSLALGRVFARETARGEAVGVLLPNVAGVAATFFALQAIGRTPAMLNFTAGAANLQAACRAAEVKTVITARAFVAQAKLGDVVAALETQVRVLYLEDIAALLRAWDRLRALLLVPFAGLLHRRHRVSPAETAVILFTSGSEGLPKGVALTHRNLNSNRHQLAARIDFNPTDIVFNALPVFHSFGLTGGTLLPILAGIRTFLYPSPLHYRIVPALVYDTNATILFGTDTFLSGYARMAHPYDFYAVRYVFAGAEKVRDQTRQIWSEKFGLRILEGYGATEAAPVIAVNTPMHFKAGTVGRLLPAVEARLDPVPGIDEGGRLSVRGPNIMAGYLTADAPGQLKPPSDGWHDTGDIVTLDDAGFVTIRGRAKRFAKIGGEMVSLPAVEGYATSAWPGFDHAVVTRPDARKGEQLVLFTTKPDAKPADLLAWGRANGVTELMLPRDIRILDALPVLGTGKIDYVSLNAMAASALAASVERAAE